MTCQLQSPYHDWWRIIWFKRKLSIKLNLGLSIVAWNDQYCCHIQLDNGDERMGTYKMQWHQLEVFKFLLCEGWSVLYAWCVWFSMILWSFLMSIMGRSVWWHLWSIMSGRETDPYYFMLPFCLCLIHDDLQRKEQLPKLLLM